MRRTTVLFLGGTLVALIVAACSGPSEPTGASDSNGGSAESEVESGDAGGDEEAEDSAALPELGRLALEWTTEEVGSGIKPAFAIDGSGVAHTAFLTEEIEGGYLFYANNASGAFEVEQVAEGYFYGPVDIAVSADGVPYIAYHDHQDVEFQTDKGDEVVAIKSGDSWELTTVSDAGHDGWDNSIALDADGNWHTAAIDPAQFNGVNGVEYATNAGGSIVVEPTGSGALNYEFGTSIQVAPDGTPGVTFYNNVAGDLGYAIRAGGSWSAEVVDEEGDTGRYASLAYDADGNAHISYYLRITDETGIVRYAWWDGSAWQKESVAMLDDVVMGFIGARKITALALDDDGNAHLAYTDRSRVVYAQRDADGNWSAQDVISDPAMPLGQLVELALGADGNPRLIWFEQTATSPSLQGNVIYSAAS